MRTKLMTLAVIVASLMVFGCGIIIPWPPDVPKPPRPRPRATATATATANATETATATATTTPSPTPTPSPTARPSTVPTIASKCDPRFTSTFEPHVMSAQRQYRLQHPEQFSSDGKIFLPPTVQEVYIQGIADILIAQGIDAIVDICMCGDMAVADSRVAQGTGFAEQFHPIASNRVIQTGGYLERCTPRWFGPPVPMPLPSPTPRRTPVVTDCPPLTQIGGKEIGPPFQQTAALWCQDIDFTPRFDVYGPECTNPAGGCPCSPDKPTCSPTCQPNQKLNKWHGGPNLSVVGDKNWRVRVCAKKGTAFDVWVEPGKFDEAGRPMKLGKFEVKHVTGRI